LLHARQWLLIALARAVQDRPDVVAVQAPFIIAEWPVPIRRADFERVLFASDGMMAIWGYWTSASGYHEEVCHVRSALVSPARSSALLRALQSADNHHDYRVPNADDDTQIDFGPYRWKVWVIDRDHDRGIDKKDPWAGNIGYPAPAPSPEIIDLMKLVPDRELDTGARARSGADRGHRRNVGKVPGEGRRYEGATRSAPPGLLVVRP
jgi:hypothetical protein